MILDYSARPAGAFRVSATGSRNYHVPPCHALRLRAGGPRQFPIDERQISEAITTYQDVGFYEGLEIPRSCPRRPFRHYNIA